jgi:hypothetical protein
VQRRCVSPLRRGHSGCRPRHGLHDQEQITAHARLPGVFQGAGARALGHTGRLREASQYRAGIFGKACQRQAAQTQESGKARPKLTATRLALPTLPGQLEQVRKLACFMMFSRVRLSPHGAFALTRALRCAIAHLNDAPITLSSPRSRDNLTPCGSAAHQHLPRSEERFSEQTSQNGAGPAFRLV